MSPEAEAAKRWLIDAVQTTGERHAGLWLRNVGERARVAHVFRYLCEVVPATWDVDCEYNREENAPKTSAVNVSGRGTPDIVVHRRGRSGPGNNLLVVEFKNTYSNQRPNSLDIQKVDFWVNEFEYQVGAVVGFGRSGKKFDPKVVWLPRDSGVRETHSMAL